MSHVDVKLASTEVAGPVNMFYPDGSKSAHMRQKLEDAIWEVNTTDDCSLVSPYSFVYSFLFVFYFPV